VGRFLCGRPSSALTVSDRWDPLIRVVFPQILHGRALAGIATAIPAATPSTRHHPFVMRMPTCAPATLSRHVDCGAPWRPITAARLCLPSSALRRSDSEADRSVTKLSSRPLRWASFRCRMRAVEAIILRCPRAWVRWHSPSCRVARRCFYPCFRDRLTVARPNHPPPFFLGRSRSTHPPRSSFPRHGRFPSTTRAIQRRRPRR
jgi:hypothetical protein